MAKKKTEELPVIEVYQEDVPQEQSLKISNSAVALLTITDEKIKELKEKYGSLKVETIDDVDSFNAAKEGNRLLVSVRNAVDKKRIAINKSFTDAVNGEAKRITAELGPLEIHTKSVVDSFNKLKKEHEEREYTRKKKVLEEAGFQFDGRAYVCGPQMIFADDIAEMPDADIESKCEIAREYIAEEKRLAEEKRIADEQAKQEAADALLRAQEAQKKVEEQDKQITELQAQLQALQQSQAKQAVTPITDAAPDEVLKSGAVGMTMPPIELAPTKPINPNPQSLVGSSFVGRAGSITPNASFLHKETPAVESKSKSRDEQDRIFDTGSAAPGIDADELIFDSGYECFRKQIIEAFSRDHKLTRPQWVSVFNQMNSTENVKTTIARIIAA